MALKPKRLQQHQITWISNQTYVVYVLYLILVEIWKVKWWISCLFYHKFQCTFLFHHPILHLSPLGLFSVGNYLLIGWFSPGHIWTCCEPYLPRFTIHYVCCMSLPFLQFSPFTEFWNQCALCLRKFVHAKLPRPRFDIGFLRLKVSKLPVSHPCMENYYISPKKKLETMIRCLFKQSSFWLG